MLESTRRRLTSHMLCGSHCHGRGLPCGLPVTPCAAAVMVNPEGCQEGYPALQGGRPEHGPGLPGGCRPGHATIHSAVDPGGRRGLFGRGLPVIRLCCAFICRCKTKNKPTQPHPPPLDVREGVGRRCGWGLKTTREVGRGGGGQETWAEVYTEGVCVLLFLPSV